jgi:hypothetical protein
VPHTSEHDTHSTIATPLRAIGAGHCDASRRGLAPSRRESSGPGAGDPNGRWNFDARGAISSLSGFRLEGVRTVGWYLAPTLGASLGLSLAVTLGVAALADVPRAANAPPAPGAGRSASPVTYDVAPRPIDQGRLSQGWGLFATLSGRSMDVGARDFQWSEDRSVQPHDVEAGYGWRRGAATAMLGYEQHDFGPQPGAAYAPDLKDTDAHRIGGSGVLGLSLVLHGH